MKLLYLEGADLEALLLLRAWIALPMIWAWAAYRMGLAGLLTVPGRLMAGAFIAGIASYYMGAWLDFAALTLIDASLERVLLFSYPIIIVLVRALSVRRWPSHRVTVAVSVTYLGVICAVGGFHDGLWRANGFGALMVMGSACLFAYYLLANERFAQRAGSIAFIFFAMLGATVALSIHFSARAEVSDLALSARAWSLLILMTAATNVLPLFIFSACIQRIGAQRAAVISSIGPPSTILLAFIFLGEVMHAAQLLGAALIVVGIVILETGRDAAPRPLAAPVSAQSGVKPGDGAPP